MTAALVADDDPYLWLEDIEGEKALAWVRARNERSQARLEGDARYAATAKAIREIVLAPDRLALPAYYGGWVYNFWQDEKAVRGLWRRTTLDEYRRDEPQWQVLIDLDDLARREDENWVWKGATCLPPTHERCLLQLSRGGKDAVVVREFDVARREFVTDGFNLPEAKSDVSWIDRDTIFVGTDYGPGSLTESGYPRIVKAWRRGTPLTDAVVAFEGRAEDVSVWGATFFRPEGNVALVSRGLDFFRREDYLYRLGQPLTRLPFPEDAQLQQVFEGRLFTLLRSEWKPGATVFPAGSVVALPLDSLGDPARAELVLQADEHTAIQGLATTRGRVYASVVEDVKGRMLALTRTEDGTWRVAPEPYPDHGVVGVLSADDFADEAIFYYSSFLVPTTVYLSRPGEAPAVLKRARERFDTKGIDVEQQFALSRDGTRVPYFVVRPHTLPEGGAPTLLDGYGGFEVSMAPYYLAHNGKVWLEKGGVYVLANLRGGGEYGPHWHDSVVKENRVKVFEDMIAVAEDLIARKITTPRKLAITGGSNGGLTVGATFTRRPDLFAAVLCEVPLLDMLRYDKLLAGASWSAEYGAPDDPKMHEILRSYSPYQNLSKDKKYPEVFFLTSTKDDRVHPGHARKMAARMEEMGHPYLYFENIEGGHGAAANLEQYIHRRTLLTVFLYQKLMDGR
jgi:prolyl oligopeptidase